MTIELWTLLGSIALLFMLNMLQSMNIALTDGVQYVWGNRNEPPKPTPISGRIQRSKANLIENLLIFAPLILVAQFLGISTGLTVLGSLIFIVARILYTIVYVAGITHIRSPIWGLSLVGMAMIAVAIFQS